MAFPRHAAATVRWLLEQFPVVAIVGSRQCGKSWLSAHAVPEWQHFDLERRRDLDAISRDPDFFFEQHPRHLVIDEAQELPALFPALRVAVDANRTQPGRFVITGSSAPSLLDAISESLAGRIATIELGTLKATEAADREAPEFYGRFTQRVDEDSFDDLGVPLDREPFFQSWQRGGYPEAIELPSDRFQTWMDAYSRTYIDRDVRRLFPGLDLHAYRRLVSMLANLSGQVVNTAELARSLAVSEPTASKYLNIAHGTFVWRRLPAYTKDAMKRVVKAPRGHIRDSGLLLHLLNINRFEDLNTHPHVGRFWETFVIEEILKGLSNAQIGHQAYYYRTHNGAEIDLILEGGFGIVPVEIKYGTTVDGRALRSLREFVAERDLPVGLVVNNAPTVTWLAPKILQVPATML